MQKDEKTNDIFLTWMRLSTEIQLPLCIKEICNQEGKRRGSTRVCFFHKPVKNLGGSGRGL